MTRLIRLLILAIGFGLALSLAVSGCAAPKAPARLPTTEAEVRQTFAGCNVVKVLDKDGTHLVVYLRPRPAAPRGGMLVYEVLKNGTVRCVRTVVAD